MSHAAYRRWFGLLLGMLVGLAYSLISQGINLLFLAGLPLYQPPFGPVGNILVGVLLGAALGFLAALPESSALGVVFSCLLGGLVLMIASLLTGNTAETDINRKIAAVIIIYVPTSALLAVPLALFRFVVNREESQYREVINGIKRTLTRRYLLPAGLVLAAALLGLTALYPPIGRAVMPRMQAIIQAGMKETQIDALPKPLRPPGVDNFIGKAHGVYSLQWDKDETNRYAIPRPASNPSEQSTVIARFENGYLLACMFPGASGEPECRDVE